MQANLAVNIRNDFWPGKLFSDHYTRGDRYIQGRYIQVRRKTRLASGHENMSLNLFVPS